MTHEDVQKLEQSLEILLEEKRRIEKGLVPSRKFTNVYWEIAQILEILIKDAIIRSES